MKQLWNVRGVSEERRKLAKMLAARSGMAMGEWIERLIGEAATRPDLKKSGGKSEEVKTEFHVAEDPPVAHVGEVFRYVGKKPQKAPKVCAHGTMKGNNCWQCGGLAVVQ
jgi:hypothetical protein